MSEMNLLTEIEALQARIRALQVGAATPRSRARRANLAYRVEIRHLSRLDGIVPGKHVRSTGAHRCNDKKCKLCGGV